MPRLAFIFQIHRSGSKTVNSEDGGYFVLLPETLEYYCTIHHYINNMHEYLCEVFSFSHDNYYDHTYCSYHTPVGM